MQLNIFCIIFSLNIFLILLLFYESNCNKNERRLLPVYSDDITDERERRVNDEDRYDSYDRSSGSTTRRPKKTGNSGKRDDRQSGGVTPGQSKKQSNNWDSVSEGTVVNNREYSKNNRNNSSGSSSSSSSGSSSGKNNNNNNNRNKKPKTKTNRNNSRSATTEPKSSQNDEELEDTYEETTADSSPDISLADWKSVERLKHHWENTAHTKSELSRKFVFWLDRTTSYRRYDACLTPENALGSCHFVQHCPILDVIRSFDKFLSYVCFIRNRYVGICCPDDYLTPVDVKPLGRPSRVQSQTTRRPTREVSTTKRRQVLRPQIPVQNDNGSDGSDYYNGICGVSENTRIIGGALANPKDWIWMAALLLKSQTQPYCGGALVTNQHILTAAHCLKDLTPEDIIIRLGAYDFSASADPEAQDFVVDYFKIHPKYNRQTYDNDMAIVKLRTKTRFTDSVKPICLPQKNRNYAGQLALVTGWGHTTFNGKNSPKLRQVSLPVWNNTACDSVFSTAITDQMLCAGNPAGGKDSCQGDSGGPLMITGPNKRWMIIGVVSWGVNCGRPNSPGVYSRVSRFIDWVQQNTRDI
ncbi:proclotting enzyme-like [Oppia nitens]|uniref:proclotting enzyme-like n=1 Tax=Oppia nitens TaxID=1686743 RepID=UPI0023DB5D29|nr:proclotting enzyme-like [Oppia nitens]